METLSSPPTWAHRLQATKTWRRPCDREHARALCVALDSARSTWRGKRLDSTLRAEKLETSQKRWTASARSSTGDFTGLLFICIYLFIFYLLVVPIEWMTDRRTIRMQVQLDQPSHVVSSPVSHLIRDSCIFYSLRLLQWFKVYKVSFQRS